MSSKISFDGETVYVGEGVEKRELNPREILNISIFFDYIQKKADPNVGKYWKIRHEEDYYYRTFEDFTFKGNLENAILNARDTLKDWDQDLLYLIDQELEDQLDELTEDFFPREENQTLEYLRQSMIKIIIDLITGNGAVTFFEEVNKPVII